MDYSQVLKEAYQYILLNVEGKEIPIPYRINIPPIEHPARQGKSSPDVILKQLYLDAKEQSFDLKKASVEEIQEFMRKNHLGLDCSGFVYRMLDFLTQRIQGKALIELGFEHVGRTNVATLTSDEHSTAISDFSDIQARDIIRLNSEGDILHCLLVMERKGDEITYAHCSRETNPKAVHLAKAKVLNNQFEFKEDLGEMTYNISAGDGVRRLKIL